MPRFVKAEDIPMAKRLPHLNRYRSQLRDALMHPALSETQRADLKERIANLGQPKPYAALAARANLANPPVTPETEEETADSTDGEQASSASVNEVGSSDLLALTKDELIALATKEEVAFSTSWTKPKIAEAILQKRGE